MNHLEVAAALRALPMTLKKARLAAGLTVRSAAEIIGVAPATVCRIELRYGCSIETAARVFCGLDHPRFRQTGER